MIALLLLAAVAAVVGMQAAVAVSAGRLGCMVSALTFVTIGHGIHLHADCAVGGGGRFGMIATGLAVANAKR